MTFDAEKECEEVGCFYNRTNWWLEEFIHSKEEIHELEKVENDNFSYSLRPSDLIGLRGKLASWVVLKSDERRGLNAQEALARLKEFGLNQLQEKKTAGPLAIFFEQFQDFILG
jgi:magnesium-transporting ATPase (P-type)